MANETVSYISHQARENGYGVDYTSCAVGFDLFGFPSGSCKGALRFTNVVLNQGVSINMAYLVYKYSSVGQSSGSWKFKVNGIDEDNTDVFDSSHYPFGRTPTTAQNNYDEGPPTSGGSKTMDVKSIVEEIIGRGGWSSGNAMGFLLEDLTSTSNVFAYANLSTSYLVYRLSAEPDFTPTPTTVSAPSIPTPGNYGIKISQPGINVLQATEAQQYYNSGKKRFKVKAEGQITTSANPHNIAHGLSYIPFCEAFVKVGTEWFRLPFLNFSGGSNVGYMKIDGTNLKIYTSVGATVYYYIFLDQLAT